MAEKVLVLFSGGFDSTAMVKKLLTETDYQLDVLRFQCGKNRLLERTERHAAAKIVDYFRTGPFRAFNYAETAIATNIDMYKCRIQAASRCNEQRAKGIKYNYVAIGRTKNDLDFFICTCEDVCECAKPGKQFADVDEKFLEMLHPELINGTSLIYPVENMDKAEIIEYLSPDLLNYPVTCRNPRIVTRSSIEPCTSCYSCKDVQHALESNSNLLEHRELARHVPR